MDILTSLTKKHNTYSNTPQKNYKEITIIQD